MTPDEYEEEIKRLKRVIEHDRTLINRIYCKINQAINGHAWLLEEQRGSYAYDDTRYYNEFGDCLRNIRLEIEDLKEIGSNWVDCPLDTNEIILARKDITNADNFERIVHDL